MAFVLCLGVTLPAWAQPTSLATSAPLIDGTPTPRPLQEEWIGTLKRGDDKNVVLSSKGKVYELTGLIERELLSEIGNEVTLTGRTFDGESISVIKVEPVPNRRR